MVAGKPFAVSKNKHDALNQGTIFCLATRDLEMYAANGFARH